MKKQAQSQNASQSPKSPRRQRSSDSTPASPSQLVTLEMTSYCFDVLITKLNHLPPPVAPNFPKEPYPVFVSWKKLPELTLRGCIGTFAPLPLYEGLARYALDSALRDSRFSPIQNKEITHLQVSVSLLTNFETGKDCFDWVIGTHGIEIEFVVNGQPRTATFLPEIASEQGWTPVETIDALLRKGGFEGPISPEIRSAIKLKRYQSQKLSTNYEDYERARNEDNDAIMKMG